MKDQTSMFEMFEEDDDKKDEVDHLYIDVKDMSEKEKFFRVLKWIARVFLFYLIVCFSLLAVVGLARLF